MNKQIEEMARVTCQMYTQQYEKRCAGVGECDYKCLHYQRCEVLYDMGYRKASDVAREIFEDIIGALEVEIITEHKKANSALDAQNVASYEVYSYAEDKLDTIVIALKLYKKKYEREGAE